MLLLEINILEILFSDLKINLNQKKKKSQKQENSNLACSSSKVFLVGVLLGSGASAGMFGRRTKNEQCRGERRVAEKNGGAGERAVHEGC